MMTRWIFEFVLVFQSRNEFVSFHRLASLPIDSYTPMQLFEVVGSILSEDFGIHPGGGLGMYIRKRELKSREPR